MKRFFKLALVLCMVFSVVLALVACGEKTTAQNGESNKSVKFLTSEPQNRTADSSKKVKVGLICLHDESSTYDKNFIDSMYRALEKLGLSNSDLELVTGIGEDNSCYEKANELAATCDIVFADSFGHEPYLLRSAKENPDVVFCHATGTQAHTANQANYFNAFASIYEGRYLAGIAAGMKLNEMIAAGKFTAQEAKMGYVGAYPYAEVVSGYTSFYLGAKSVCPSVTMEVRYTSSWYDYDKEYAAAKALIEGGCKLISQHADSYGAPTACEETSTPNVTYNGTTESKCPNTYIVSSKIDWTPYYMEMIGYVLDGKTETYKDCVGTLASGSVKLDACGRNAAAGTQEAIDAAIAKLNKGELHVYDVSTFTVGGKTLTTYLADVDDDGTFTGETEVIKDGYFHESEYRSAPYFDLRIDGIREINE